MTVFVAVNKKKGFTLLELLMVLLIIGVILSIVLASFTRARAVARDNKRQSDIAQLQLALEMFYNTNGQYPRCNTTQSSSCTIDTTNGNICSTTGYAAQFSSLATALAPYLSSIPSDPTNINGGYGYYYARCYKKTGPNSFSLSGSPHDYIIATRFETVETGITVNGWNNSALNYLSGSGQF